MYIILWYDIHSHFLKYIYTYINLYFFFIILKFYPINYLNFRIHTLKSVGKLHIVFLKCPRTKTKLFHHSIICFKWWMEPCSKIENYSISHHIDLLPSLAMNFSSQVLWIFLFTNKSKRETTRTLFFFSYILLGWFMSSF